MSLSKLALAACALLLVHRTASAQMIPLTDDREIVTNVRYDGVSKHDAKSPSGAFVTWFEFVGVNVTGTPDGSAQLSAFQSADFTPSTITFSGGTSSTWSNHAMEQLDAKSHLRWTVRANQCLEYNLYATIDPGIPVNAAYVDLSGPGGTLYHLVNGALNVAGRLPPGDYVFEADAPLTSKAQTATGGTHNVIWQCAVCTSSLITLHPVDPVIRCDTTATFCVVPNGPVGSFTYQWRRNYVPLANSAHYSGVNTPCLSIQHACYADNGYFDVVVSNGLTSEASRGAHVGISSIAVGVPPGAGVGWSLGVAVPSPSRETSSFRYAAPAPFHARATIHDAAGRVVRQLADRVFEGSGTLSWDGRSEAGAPAVPGIYFLRFERDGAVDVRRIVRVR